MKNKYIIRLLLLSITMVGFGCTSEGECRQELSVNFKAGIYTVADESSKALSVDSIWVKGFAKDSFLYKDAKKISTIKLPLNAATEQSNFIIQFNDLKDTIGISYTTNPAYFISLPCGCIATHTINKVVSTDNFIDSIHIIQPEVLNYDAEQIKIYHN
ncbi:MAG: hypothetical protein KA206_07735 [Paludibacter sp.]|nr:hypothetical protein [Paludibacter sp.]